MRGIGPPCFPKLGSLEDFSIRAVSPGGDGGSHCTQAGTQGWRNAAELGGAEGGTAIFVVILTTQMYFYGQ